MYFQRQFDLHHRFGSTEYRLSLALYGGFHGVQECATRKFHPPTSSDKAFHVWGRQKPVWGEDVQLFLGESPLGNVEAGWKGFQKLHWVFVAISVYVFVKQSRARKVAETQVLQAMQRSHRRLLTVGRRLRSGEKRNQKQKTERNRNEIQTKTVERKAWSGVWSQKGAKGVFGAARRRTGKSGRVWRNWWRRTRLASRAVKRKEALQERPGKNQNHRGIREDRTPEEKEEPKRRKPVWLGWRRPTRGIRRPWGWLWRNIETKAKEQIQKEQKSRGDWRRTCRQRSKWESWPKAWRKSRWKRNKPRSIWKLRLVLRPIRDQRSSTTRTTNCTTTGTQRRNLRLWTIRCVRGTSSRNPTTARKLRSICTVHLWPIRWISVITWQFEIFLTFSKRYIVSILCIDTLVSRLLCRLFCLMWISLNYK